MTSIKELLELDSKQTIFGTNTQINTFGGWGSDNKAFIKASPDMAAKLREIVEMLPDIKSAITGYALLQEDMGLTDINLIPDKCEKLHDKLVKWENS